MHKRSAINILIPMAGRGGAFIEAGFAFPKPMIDIGGKTMIEVVVNNLRPNIPHRFIFVCLKDQYDKYDFYNIFKRSSNNMFEVVTIHGATKGAACTALTAIEHINNDNELLIVNADQFLTGGIDTFVGAAQKKNVDGYVMTFPSSHPRWSYARVTPDNRIIEVAEKKVISSHATVGAYYYKRGSDFVAAAQSMIGKNITHNNEFYVCPVYNELILSGKEIYIDEIPAEAIYGLGTPEDLAIFQKALDEGRVGLEKVKVQRLKHNKQKTGKKSGRKKVRKSPKKKKK
jgi:NDP-sugar pyrophosphorylase family protein